MTQSGFRIYDDVVSESESQNRYSEGSAKKSKCLVLGIGVSVLCVFASLVWSNSNHSIDEILSGFLSFSVSTPMGRFIWNIDMPIIVAAVVVGASLSLAGVVMQCVLKNPLASPYTLGLSNAAAFGAAFSVIFFDSGALFSSAFLNSYCTPVCAFAFSMIATMAILFLMKVTRISSETMVLGGIALSAVFSAGLTLMQYLADPVQLSSIVSWTFGTLSYADWKWDLVLIVVLIVCATYFDHRRWDLNAMNAGDEVAKGLGVNTERFLIVSMTLASLLSAFMVARFGVIAFVGLLGPHMARMVVGDDHRFLLPASMVSGTLLMVIANMIAINIVRPMVLPVGLLTSLLGGPAFIILLVRRYKR